MVSAPAKEPTPAVVEHQPPVPTPAAPPAVDSSTSATAIPAIKPSGDGDAGSWAS